ncbi:MAG: type VI secretion system tube protein Hcp [Saprospiraceae bacterium]|nr:type VI secretion system tube protein Hcp [Saprospiraceae bacterium]
MKFSLAVFLFLPIILAAQNVGIGTSDPSEKLQVNGMIYTSQGGIKFPDNTVQTTAAFNNTGVNQQAGPIIMTISGPGMDFKGNVNAYGLLNGINLIDQYEVMTRPVSSTQGGVTLGKTELKEYTIRKSIDNTSTAFFKAMANGTQLSEVYIYYIKPGLLSNTNANRLIQAVFFSDVFVTNQEQFATESGELVEEITFHTSSICKYSYKPGGGGSDAVLTFGYNFLSLSSGNCPTISN